jgi:hypothetical protein
MISPAMKDQILALTAIVATYAKAMDERLATELSDEITEAYDTYKQRFQKKESLKQELETETDTLKKGISRILTTISNRAEKYIVSQQGTHTN